VEFLPHAIPFPGDPSRNPLRGERLQCHNILYSSWDGLTPFGFVFLTVPFFSLGISRLSKRFPSQWGEVGTAVLVLKSDFIRKGGVSVPLK